MIQVKDLELVKLMLQKVSPDNIIEHLICYGADRRPSKRSHIEIYHYRSSDGSVMNEIIVPVDRSIADYEDCLLVAIEKMAQSGRCDFLDQLAIISGYNIVAYPVNTSKDVYQSGDFN